MTDATPESQRRHRMLLKLAVIWQAHPDKSLADVLHRTMSQHSRFDGDFGSWYLSDDYVEETFDTCIAAENLSVSGGWQS